MSDPQDTTPPPRRPVQWGNRGYGIFEAGRFYLIRCGDCGRENYALAVRHGGCAWCGAEPADRLKEQANG